MATSGGASALQGRFSELDRKRLYALTIRGSIIFKFVVNHAEGKIIIQNGKEAGHVLKNEDLTRFEDPIYKINDIGAAPSVSSVRTAGYTNKTAAERANEFRQRDPEGGNEYKQKKYKNIESPVLYNQYIKYFGLENVPKDKLKSAVRRLNLFFKNAYNTKIEMNAKIFDSLKATVLSRITAIFPINPDAMAFRSHENFSNSARSLTEFLATFIGNNSSLATKLPKNMNEATGEGTELQNLGEGGGAGMNEATGEGTELQNLGEGGGAGMNEANGAGTELENIGEGGDRMAGGRHSHKRNYRRSRRGTKRRSVKRRRTRCSRK
jgi:hypothetical protein